MIGKVSRGKNVGGLLRYLFGPGRANEHTNPHLVASWMGDERPMLDGLEPAFTGSRPDVADLAARLALPMQLRPDAVDRPVWQCSMRVADGDRRLTDAQWATVARDGVERTGFAPAGDAGGCRWVAVRHADDHIHIAVVLARQDGGRVEVFRDWPKVHAAARAAEQRFGLQVVVSPDRTATVAPTRAEAEKAVRVSAKERRVGTAVPARAWLTRQVRAAAAGSVDREEFEQSLSDVGVLVHWRQSQRTPGQITGYAVGRRGDVDSTGAQVWFGGSKLSPDLSLPKLRARWSEVRSPDGAAVPRPRQPLGKHEREQVLTRAELALRRAAIGQIDANSTVAAGEVLAVLARAAEGPGGGTLTDYSERYSRAARLPRGRRPTARLRAHPLRMTAAQLSLLGHLLPEETRHLMRLLAHIATIAGALASRASTRGLDLVVIHSPGAQPSETLAVRTPASGLSESVAASAGPSPSTDTTPTRTPEVGKRRSARR